MKETIKIPPALEGRIWLHQSTGQVRLPHRHEELEVNLVVQGTASYLVDNRRYVLTRNTQIWLFPEQEHILLEDSSDYQMWILVFKASLLRSVCQSNSYQILLKGDPGYFCKPLLEHQCARLKRLFEEVLEAESDSARFNTGLAYSLLSAWSAQQVDERITPSFDIHPAVERAARLIHEEQEPVSLDELGRLAGLSASRLSRLFKAQTGVSLVEYRNKQRLNRFLSLYGQGRRVSMMSAALAAGFGSYPQFHRIFKQIMGYGPAEHRRRIL